MVGVICGDTKCIAYWFLTDVLSVCEKLETKLDFISISLFKKEHENFCHIIYDDGNGQEIFKQEYTATDFPLFNNDGEPAIKLQGIINNDTIYGLFNLPSKEYLKKRYLLP